MARRKPLGRVILGLVTAVACVAAITSPAAAEPMSPAAPTAAVAQRVLDVASTAAEDASQPSSVATSPNAALSTTLGRVEHRVSENDTISFSLPTSGSPRNVGDTAVYSGSDSRTHVSVEPLADGSRTSAVISDRGAPRVYPFDFNDDVSLELQTNGEVTILNADAEPIGSIDKPWAVDATGRKIETNFAVKGNVLTQIVAHDHRNVTYPVVADPSVHWWGVQWLLSKRKTDLLIVRMNTGAGAAAVIAAVCGGTIAGAIPCGAGYAVFAALAYTGTGFIVYCNRGKKGIKLRYHWGAGFTCAKR